MTKPYILDTDCSGDVDDVGDLAVSLTYHRLGHLDMIGIEVCVTRPKTPGTIRAICATRGQGAIPIYSLQGTSFDPSGAPVGGWPDHVYDNYPHPGVGLSNTLTDSTTGYRTMLAAATEPVTIVNTGFAAALDALLLSPADEISPLTGAELIAQKVEALYWVAGYWPNNSPGEYNIALDAARASHLVDSWPAGTPLVFVGCEIGDPIMGATTLATSLAADDPVRVAYQQADAPGGRPAWGLIGIMAAAENEAVFCRTRGTGTINPTTGENSFTASPTGPHYFLTTTVPNAVFASYLEQLVVASPTANPPLTTWSTRSLVSARVT